MMESVHVYELEKHYRDMEAHHIPSTMGMLNKIVSEEGAEEFKHTHCEDYFNSQVLQYIIQIIKIFLQ